MESSKSKAAINPKIGLFRFLVLFLIAAISLTAAAANALGYIWAGAWLRPAGTACAAAYLPVFFALAWILVPAKSPLFIRALWLASAMALGICVFAFLLPEQYPLKITVLDFIALFAIPFGAYLYRRLSCLKT